MPRFVDPEVARQVSIQAKAAGMDPLDLMTIIGYETGGTYNPWQKGPTTKHGQHRGFIQWGVPQREKYGVTQDTSIGDQVKASIQYLRDRGWRPGMGRLPMYAAINAGHVSKTNLSDAKAGGAWGTVADKVRYQMAGHERRARQLLGQYDNDPAAAAAAAPPGVIGPLPPRRPGGGGPLPPRRPGAGGIPGGVSPSDLPWGGYGYKPPQTPQEAPPGLADLPAPGATPTGLTGAPNASYTVEPNSDAARMLSDPARYGLNAEKRNAMAAQLAQGGPGGGSFGNIPPPVPKPASGPPTPLQAQSAAPPLPPPRPSGPGPIQGAMTGPDGQDTGGFFIPPGPAGGDAAPMPGGLLPQNQPGTGGQGSVAQLFDDFRNRQPLNVFQGGWA